VTVQELFELGVAHHRAGRVGEAVGLYRQILEVDPTHAEAMLMMGIASQQMGRPGEAVEWIGRAIAVDPTNPGYYVNFGNALRSAGDMKGAVAAYRNAIGIQPALADAWNNLGGALQESGEVTDAIEAHRKALSLRPDFVQAWYNLGGAFSRVHRIDEAIEAYGRALESRADFDAAQVNRANLLRHVGRLDESIAALRRVVEMRPTPVALSNLIYDCYFHPGYDTTQIGHWLSKWNELFGKPLAKEIRPLSNSRDPERRLRIGYVSPDFNGHPAGRFFLPLVAHHDHTRFEVICYSDVSDADAVTNQIRSHVDVWRDTRTLSDEQLAARVREDRIDVLIDLTLHLAQNRMLAFARKPAPVQATWLAYPGSSGLTTMDYRISDPHLDPPGKNDEFYSEKTLLLPDCYWCYDPQCPAVEVGELPAVSNGYVTFGCLNNFAKVTEVTIRLWAQILRRVSNSRLILLAPEGSARDWFSGVMRACGIDAGCIEFVDRLPRQQYMETYRRIDVSLDTFPCNAHTTAFDSLWMGVPIVSLYGTTAMSRGGLSILANLGMQDWCTDDPTNFVEIAVRTAADVQSLFEIRRTLRSRLKNAPLMDGPRFAQNMEQLYRDVWSAWCKTSPPAGG
jgi:predicted O-linked N-acetylglucosamine transferase (SPINDLY family)